MDAYVKFYAPVLPATVVQLQRTVEQLISQSRITKLHLLLSTPGGSVHDGISMYNLLKGLPIEVATYNFGSVDSIGVVIFCAGTSRFSVPNARFLIHPVSMQVQAASVFDEPSLQEKLDLLKADQLNIANVISQTITKSVDEIEKMIENRTTLTPERAKELGLVTEIKAGLVPAGINLISIYDQQPPQQMLQFPMLRGLTTQPPHGISSINDSYTSI